MCKALKTNQLYDRLSKTDQPAEKNAESGIILKSLDKTVDLVDEIRICWRAI
jgi:hypothetical protein